MKHDLFSAFTSYSWVRNTIIINSINQFSPKLRSYFIPQLTLPMLG